MNNKILRLTVIIITALSLASCQKSLEEQVIGKWGSDDEVHCEFFEDGTVVLHSKINVKWSIIDSNRIRIDTPVNGSTITVTYDDVSIEENKMNYTLNGESGTLFKMD